MPALTVSVLGVAPRLKSTPVPDKLTVCGLPTLSLIVRVPLRVPEAVGVNTTLMVQLAPPASVPEQLLVCE